MDESSGEHNGPQQQKGKQSKTSWGWSEVLWIWSKIMWVWNSTTLLLNKLLFSAITLFFFGLIFLLISVSLSATLDLFALTKSPYNLILIRSIFILIVSTFPVVLFVLFICSRKYSLFTEFMLNLLRLGLLEEHAGETCINYQRRIYAYINRFQEYYGPFSKGMKEQISIRLECKKKDKPDKPIGFASYSTPEPLWTVPLIFTIVIISVGWIIVLPPWQTGDGSVSEITFSFLRFNLILNPINNNINDILYSHSSFFNSTNLDKNVTEAENATMINTSGLIKILNITQTPVTFAFLGAYFYSIQILVQRFLRRDLRINVFIAISQRIILGIIATWVVIIVPNIISMDPNPWAAIQYMGNWNYIGFIVGAFPTVLWEFLKKKSSSKFLFFIPNFTEKYPLSKLDGLNIWAELRFEEEDISNVPNLATANVVDLMLTTRISSERIIYWVDQAILYSTIGMEPSIDITTTTITQQDITVIKNGITDIQKDIKILQKDITSIREGTTVTKAGIPDSSEQNINSQVYPIEKLGRVGIRTATSFIEVFRTNRPATFWEKTGYKVEDIESIITSIQTNPNVKLIQTWRELPNNHLSWGSIL